MRLDQLLAQIDFGYRSEARPDLHVAGIADDSRKVHPGELFIARRGTQRTGADFARDAVARGAVAVVSQDPLPDDLGVARIIVSDASLATAGLAHAFWGRPSHAMQFVGITGTNGKTTTAYILRHLLNRAGIKCGLIGTVETDDGVRQVEAENTTPGVIELAKLLAAMRDNGCAAAVMETSSHALHQNRLAGIRFCAAGFTNLTGDHLDYHKTMEEYADAKGLLFNSLDETAHAVLNGDDPWTPRISQRCRAKVTTYAIDSDCGQAHVAADYCAGDVSVSALGTRFTLTARHTTWPVNLPLVGRHNVQNALTAALIAMKAFDLDPQDVIKSLDTAHGAPGRLERVQNPARPKLSILVDYAHTDDALENVLKALRPLTRGKLRVVFGCGGDRDPTKRPRMAAIARKLGDAVYVTSDNPRGENPNKIIDDILTGFPADSRGDVVVEPDRRAAIYRAIGDADEEDVVLIAGKGHEKYQIVGATRQHFDDVEEARKVGTH